MLLLSPLLRRGVVKGVRSVSGLSSSHLGGTSSVYVEQMWEEWKKDPQSVHSSWRVYFENVNAGLGGAAAYSPPPTLGTPQHGAPIYIGGPGPIVGASSSKEDIQRSVNLWTLERHYQVRGHHAADIDPLGRPKIIPVPRGLDPEYHGFTKEDYNVPIFHRGKMTTVQETLDRLKGTYSSTIGLEFMHIQSAPQVEFLIAKMEEWRKNRKTLTPREVILDRTLWADKFERFLELKYAGAKRFGLEGCEATIPFLKSLIDRAADLSVEEMVFGMPHRGRLNFLANVMRKPLETIFKEFGGEAKKPKKGNEYTGSGDVKYHLGTSFDRETNSGRKIHLSLVANPSHLEAANPVVEGKVRAKQHYHGDVDRKRSMSVLLHGDAAFAGQGIVYESLHFSDLPQYSTGGTIHLIVNNQIGFTTDPTSSRSTPYPTDVAKSLGCPIIHVNGDDVDACVFAAELAAEFRQKFSKTVVVDLVGYRKYGHNEIDAPDMTQPLMYKLIAQKKSVSNVYSQSLIEDGVVTKEELENKSQVILNQLEDAFAKSKKNITYAEEWLDSKWAGFKSPGQLAKIKKTGVPQAVLDKAGHYISEVPQGFTPHKGVGRVMKRKKLMIQGKAGIDWGTAEALAFGTLLLEGNHIRLSGQDVERGTFSHRHAVLHDFETGERYCPLKQLEEFAPDRSTFSVYNSSLSEFGVLGFELGYSMENPNSLVLWEAQFGDFANGAQIIFDQFLSAGEAKWLRQCGLVCLLPHGYDGQGPEHSSARLERFLQQVDSNPFEVDMARTSQQIDEQIQRHNFQVANVTTPANYFHLLRRQIHREFRKPLVVMSPKNLLRHPQCVSDISDFDDVAEVIPGAESTDVFFQRTIGETSEVTMAHPEKVKRIIFCSGKVYYELAALRKAQELEDTFAIIRVEQLAPFPFDSVLSEVERFPNAEIAWCQEEPMNMGAWTFVRDHMEGALLASRGERPMVRYFGRPPSASPATGYGKVHTEEQNALCSAALTI